MKRWGGGWGEGGENPSVYVCGILNTMERQGGGEGGEILSWGWGWRDSNCVCLWAY